MNEEMGAWCGDLAAADRRGQCWPQCPVPPTLSTLGPSSRVSETGQVRGESWGLRTRVGVLSGGLGAGREVEGSRWWLLRNTRQGELGDCPGCVAVRSVAPMCARPSAGVTHEEPRSTGRAQGPEACGAGRTSAEPHLCPSSASPSAATVTMVINDSSSVDGAQPPTPGAPQPRLAGPRAAGTTP